MSRGETHRSVGLGLPPRRQQQGRLFAGLCLLASLVPVLMGALLLGAVLRTGAGLEEPWAVVDRLAHSGAEGLLGSVIGSLWLVSLCVAVAIPVGVGAALHLEGPRRFGRSLLAINMDGLAAVPSVLFGLVGLEVFVRALHMGHSLAAAALTLALLVVPIVAVAARAALRAVPDELREAGYALGATPWQVTRQVVLPVAWPGILSGAILAIGRAFGEAAPLLIVAGIALHSTAPSQLGDPQHVLPLHIFEVLARPEGAPAADAVVGMVVLLGTLLVLSAWAMRLRYRHERRRDG